MKILHTMLRVGDLERSVGFYTGVLGMRVLRTTERPEQKYSLAFVGYGDESQGAVLELTYNHGVDHYDLADERLQLLMVVVARGIGRHVLSP